MKKTKSVLSVVLCLLMLVAVVPVMDIGIKASAASYNVSAAVAFAKSHAQYDIDHYNAGPKKYGAGYCSNGWLCAGFVSACLGQGGVSIPNYSYYNSSQQSYNNIGGTLGNYTNPFSCSEAQLVYFSECGYQIISDPSNSQIDIGDVVFLYGTNRNTNGRDDHVGICVEKDSNGKVYYAAHNSCTASSALSSSYPCTYVIKMNGTTYTEAPTAPTFATIYTDFYSYAVDERVYFHISSDGIVNNLWIYCPNGQTLTYEDVGTEYDLGFGMSGEFEALVQSWNDRGDFTSERIHFLVGNPTRAEITTDAYSYAVDETVTFTCNTNGTPGRNVVWIYCPNGDTLHYSDLDSELKLGFGMSGEFEALVQAWSSTGSLTSKRIHFLIGDPTRAVLKTNYEQYLVDERVFFSCDTNGTPCHNTLWIYCPDGTSLHYSDVGSAFDLGFGMTGEYEALVQAWSSTGSLCSERIHFSVFDIPSKPIIRTATGNKDGSVTLEWTPCTANTLSYSIRFYKAGETNEYKLLNRITNETTYTYKDLPAGVYTAMITAEGNGGHTNSDMNESFTVVSHTHSYAATAIEAATCSVTGVRTFTCSCGDSYTETVPVNPSNHVNTKNVAATASTCTVKGYTSGVYCNDCKQYISGHAEQPLAAHQTTTQNAKAATCTAEGYTGDQVCTVCNQTITKGTAIAKKAHTMTTVNQKAAGCTTAGYTGDQVCTTCNQTITKGSVINALGHANADSNGNCTRCGTHIKDVTPSQPSNPQPNPNACKYCGQVHSGPFGWLIKFFHSILAIFKR